MRSNWESSRRTMLASTCPVYITASHLQLPSSMCDWLYFCSEVPLVKVVGREDCVRQLLVARGGDGNRTRVPKTGLIGFYKFSQIFFISRQLFCWLTSSSTTTYLDFALRLIGNRRVEPDKMTRSPVYQASQAPRLN